MLVTKLFFLSTALLFLYEAEASETGQRTLSSDVHNYLRKRVKRSDSKFESLKKREREQRLIESGVYNTHIGTDTPDEVRVHVGDWAFLPCRVNYLGTQSVIWMKGNTVISIDQLMMNGQPRISGMCKN